MTSVDTLPKKNAAFEANDCSVNYRKPIIRSSISQKIQSSHLDRQAIVYIRQSTPQQVLEHRESRERQYALPEFAAALGWPRERIVTIDADQGQSGQRAEHRSGFNYLLAEVTLDHVGIVVGLEMSRFARSNKDWHHLLELCAIFGTLLADQDGVYDPQDPNDRLLLGLKGTISEVELHTMRNRLEKGKLHKALRGELFFGVPLGYVKTETGNLSLDPDEQARDVVALIFDKFDELGSVYAVFWYLLRHGIRLGIRAQKGPNRGELEWRRPGLTTLWTMLHHPMYAGTYAYGRRLVDPKRKHAAGGRRTTKWAPMEQWKAMLRDHVPAYISWDRFLQNQERLRRNRSTTKAPGVPRNGSALLGGLVFCTKCGTRMRVSYSRCGQPRYDCKRRYLRGIDRVCYGIVAASIDALVTEHVLRALEPAALELSVRAADDLQRERDRLTLHWKQQLERARYECVQAERRYRAVDPEYRMVARTLEKDWEQALRAEAQLKEEYDRLTHQTPPGLTTEERERIRSLATDIPALWAAPTTMPKDRKAVIRCLIERINVDIQGNTEYVHVEVVWAGGFTKQHQILRPVLAYEQLHDFDRLVERTRQLRNAGRSAEQIAQQLNADGFHPRGGKSSFSKNIVRQILPRWQLTLGQKGSEILGPGEWRLSDLARQLRVHPSKLRRWCRCGWVHARRPLAVWSYIVWADHEELDRLRRLRDYAEAHPFGRYPAALTSPRPQANRHSPDGFDTGDNNIWLTRLYWPETASSTIFYFVGLVLGYVPHAKSLSNGSHRTPVSQIGDIPLIFRVLAQKVCQTSGVHLGNAG